MSRLTGLIGAGRLGSSLALALARAGHPIAVVASASRGAAQALVQQLASAVRASADEVVAKCELVLLTVPDDALLGVAAGLAWRRGQEVVHCSGAHGLDVLEPARAAGGVRGCLHPLQAFPERFADPSRFSGIVCGVEGEGALGSRLERYASDLGASTVRLEGVDRARYHAAAVLASNYVVALHVAAAQAWSLAGLPAAQARSALAPLTSGAAHQVQRMPLETALTGPLARGDVETIAKHLHALAQAPELRELYRRLGKTLLALPLSLPPELRARVDALLHAD